MTDLRPLDQIRADVETLAVDSSSLMHVQAKQHAARRRLAADAGPLLDRVEQAERERDDARAVARQRVGLARRERQTAQDDLAHLRDQIEQLADHYSGYRDLNTRGLTVAKAIRALAAPSTPVATIHATECRYHDALGCASQPRMEPNYNPWSTPEPTYTGMNAPNGEPLMAVPHCPACLRPLPHNETEQAACPAEPTTKEQP